LLALLHLLEHTGSIEIDGINISNITRQQLRSRITVLSQDPVELPGSVRHNLDPWSSNAGCPASAPGNDDILLDVLSRVGLWDKVSANGGLGKDLSTMGFSHGQLQLFCLARAMLHQRSTKGKIVLVDEATSSVDDETDRHMQSLMKEAFDGCTVVTVAHRLNTVQGAGRLLHMEDGTVL
jgi:ABC-type multidrug transport system fused ATPase/permease subunit